MDLFHRRARRIDAAEIHMLGEVLKVQEGGVPIRELMKAVREDSDLAAAAIRHPVVLRMANEYDDTIAHAIAQSKPRVGLGLLQYPDILELTSAPKRGLIDTEYPDRGPSVIATLHDSWINVLGHLPPEIEKARFLVAILRNARRAEESASADAKVDA